MFDTTFTAAYSNKSAHEFALVLTGLLIDHGRAWFTDTLISGYSQTFRDEFYDGKKHNEIFITRNGLPLF